VSHRNIDKMFDGILQNMVIGGRTISDGPNYRSIEISYM